MAELRRQALASVIDSAPFAAGARVLVQMPAIPSDYRLSFGVGEIFQNVSPVWTRLNQTYSFEKSSVSLKDHGTEGLFFKTYPTLLTYSCSYASSYGVWRPSGEGVGGASRRCAPQRGKGIVAR
jgi:hypothetical protein